MAQAPNQDEQLRQLTVQPLQLAVRAMQAEQNKKQAVPESLKLTYASLERLLYALLVPLGSTATYILVVLVRRHLCYLASHVGAWASSFW